MRLTLRNLMRFLDQSDLRSTERRQLKDLVEKSEKAGAWIERIESLSRDANIAAPAIDARKLCEINKVAVYLDLNMDEKDTAEFERELLTNDQLLAEVAACHKIKCRLQDDDSLHVPIELRQTIYDLDRTGHAPEPEKSPNGDDSIGGLVASMEDLPYEDANVDEDSAVDGSAVESDESSVAKESYIPIEELSQKARKKSFATTLVVIVALGGIVGMAFWLGRQSVEPDQAGSSNETAEQQSPLDDASDKLRADQAKTGDTSEETDSGDPAASQDQLAFVDQPQPPEPVDGPDIDEQPAANQLPRRPSIAMRAAGDHDEVAVPVPPAKLVEVARLATPDKLMFVYPPNGSEWLRAAADEPIHSGSKLLLLRDQAVAISIGEAIDVVLLGPARYAIAKKETEDTATITIDYGRLVVRPRQINAAIAVSMGDMTGRLSMPVIESEVYFERAFYRGPGSDPREDDPAGFRTMLCRKGKGTWTVEDRPIALVPDLAWIQTGQSQPRIGAINGPLIFEQLKIPDGFGDSEFANQFGNQKKLVDQMIELTNGNRKEFRTEAIGGMAALGNCAYLIDFLNDDRNRHDWLNVIGLVRFYLANDPALAEQLFADLAQAGARQNNLYELILGYSEDQLAAGKDAELVDLLDDSELAMRVMAINNLRWITGGLTYSYRAETVGKTRRRHIRTWRTRKLEKDAIRYLNSPTAPVVNIVGIPMPDDDNDAAKDKDDANETAQDDPSSKKN